MCCIWPGEELTNFIENICKRWVVSAGPLKQNSHIVATAIRQILPFTSKVDLYGPVAVSEESAMLSIGPEGSDITLTTWKQRTKLLNYSINIVSICI